jgi:phosphoribosylanthranilate isomerase
MNAENVEIDRDVFFMDDYFCKNRIAMRPILIIEGLKNLHDARYCAAVGIAMATFDMDANSEGALAPKVVKEIAEWLSGLECIGQFESESADSILEKATDALVERVLIPISFPLDEATNLCIPLIFDARTESDTATLIQRMNEIATQNPDALFILNAAQLQTDSLSDQFLEKIILHDDDPDGIFHQIHSPEKHPYGFSLGSFVVDQDGFLDYDSCDAFLESYQAVVPV